MKPILVFCYAILDFEKESENDISNYLNIGMMEFPKNYMTYVLMPSPSADTKFVLSKLKGKESALRL